MQSRVPLGPGKFHVVVLVKLKGTSPLKENVSQNAIKEPKKKKNGIIVLILVLIKASLLD